MKRVIGCLILGLVLIVAPTAVFAEGGSVGTSCAPGCIWSKLCAPRFGVQGTVCVKTGSNCVPYEGCAVWGMGRRNSWVGVALRHVYEVNSMPEAVGACRIDISCESYEECDPLVRLSAVRRTKETGRHVLLTVTLRQPPTPRQTRVLFGAILTHYPFLEMIEVGNEPDLKTFWAGTAEQYVAFLEEAYKLIKKRSPGTQVLMAAVSGVDKDHTATGYFLRLLGLIRGRGFLPDAFAVHEYENPVDLHCRIEHYREKARERGISKPFIVTEWGCSRNRAWCLTRGLDLAREAGAARVFVFELPGNLAFGLLSRQGKPTSAFWAVQRWAAGN